MKRIYGFDIARAFAILGMMLVNYKIVFTYGKIEYSSINYFISIFEGRAAAVFLILAGIGISLMTKKSLNEISKIILYKKIIQKRAFFLFIVGMILYIFFEWTADILHFYGIYMLFISLIFYKSNKKINIYILLSIIITLALQIFLDYSYGWDIDFTHYENIFTIKGFLFNSFFNGYHPVFPWIILMLIGILIGRMNFSNKKTFRTLFSYSLLIAFITEIVSYSIIKLNNSSEIIIYFFDTKPMNPTIFYIIASSAWGIVFISLCNMIDFKIFKKFLIPTGQMALTHYVFHCVGVLLLFDLYNNLSYRNELFVIILSVIVFIIMNIFSYYWSKKFKRGPLELLMRKITS